MRKSGRIVTLICITLLLMVFLKLQPLLKGATGYSAKMMCSACFVEGMTPEQVEKKELGVFPFNKVVNKVDLEKKQVTSTLIGWVSQTAVFTEGRGATLFPDGIKSFPANGHVPNLEDQWPVDTAILGQSMQSINIAGVNKYIEEQFNETSKAVLVIKNRQIIAEKYAEGFDKHSQLLGWSMTKTLTNLMVGILVKQGKIDIEQAVNVEEWQNDDRRYITWNNLLQMSSGLEWNEDYSKTSLTDVSRMLYTESDVYKFAVGAKSIATPGTKYYYSSGTTNIISGLLRSYFDELEDYWKFPQKALFEPLQMNHSLIETDAAGTLIGSSYGYCSARDWGRMGLLLLNNGKWNGNQILPEWWVKYSTTPAKDSDGTYGAQLWLNASRNLLPDLPSDVYFANGYRGQRVTIIPSENMVIVNLNSSPEDIDFNTYTKGLLDALKK